MRKLMFFSLGLGGSCLLGSCLWVGIWMIPVLLTAAAGLWLFTRREKWMKALAWICVGVIAGIGWFFAFDRVYTAPLRELDGKILSVTMTTVSESWDTDYGSAVDCYLDLDGKRYKIRLYLKEQNHLEPWMNFSGPVEFRLTTDGGREEPTFHRSQGILALAYQRDSAEITLRSDREEGFWVLLQCAIRCRIEESIETCFGPEDAAFAKALLMGDKTDLSYETGTDFKVSGISHIVAVSGLHMSVLFGLVAFLTWKRRWLLAIFGIPAILLFMLVAGFGASVTRAGIMMILMILSLMFKREYDPPTALGFAVVSILAWNPLAASGAALQLSVGSVAGIFLFMGPVSKWIQEWVPKAERKSLKILRAWFVTSLSVTLSAQVITLPLVAVYFHTVSFVSILTNLLVVWVVSFIFYGVVLVCIFAAIWLPLGRIFAKMVSLPIRYVCLTAKVLSKVPLAAVYTESVYIVLWLCFAYGLLLLYLFGYQKRRAMSALLAFAGLVLALFLSRVEPLLYDQSVTVLDVGQGQSVILQHRDKVFVVDCGGDYDDDAADLTAQTLLSMGIRRIDGLILTHYDRDHSGGVPGLLYRVESEKVYLPAGARGEAVAALVPPGQAVRVLQTMHLQQDGLNITVIPMENADSDGESAIAVLFQTKKCDTLITGDLSALYEQILIREHTLPDLEILIAGHHGSKYATSQFLLDVTAPDAVILSVGEHNRYGHPAPETLDRIFRAGSTVYRTDEAGTIVLRR